MTRLDNGVCAGCHDTGRVVYYGSGRFAKLRPCTMCEKGKRIARRDPREIPTTYPTTTVRRA